MAGDCAQTTKPMNIGEQRHTGNGGKARRYRTTKGNRPMAWVGKMNTIRSRAIEVVNTEVIYS